MNKRTAGIAAIVVLIAIALIAIFNSRSSNEAKTPASVVVKISRTGFSPAEVTIAKGGTVKWINVDTEPHRVAANPYPTHTDLPELDSKNNIGPNSTYSFTFVKSGTVNYHDELHPTLNASVIVK
jgi:plastocyanin